MMNRETQTIMLHLGIEPEAMALAKRLVTEAADTEIAALSLESYFGVDNIRATGLTGDLVSAAMARVDWVEIARSLWVDHDPA
jgi:hypothetical protein